MNKERLQAIIDRIEADLDGWDQKFWDHGNTPRFALFTQIDAGIDLHIFNTRRDAQIWLDLSNKKVNYLFCSFRTLKEIKEFIENCNYDSDGYNLHGYDRNGYDRYGYDREGYGWGGYNREGLDKRNKPNLEQA